MMLASCGHCKGVCIAGFHGAGPDLKLAGRFEVVDMTVSSSPQGADSKTAAVAWSLDGSNACLPPLLAKPKPPLPLPSGPFGALIV